MKIDPAWYETYFGDEWLRIALHFGDVSVESEADFIENALSLTPGMHLLDMPCGHGRHSIELARRGIRVTGVDLMPGSVRLAEEAARGGTFDFQPRFRTGDMRTFVSHDPVDAVIMMQSSFGFMETEEQDREILCNIRRSLAPGGKMMVDIISLFRLARTMVVPRRWERLDDGSVHIEDRAYDFRTGRRTVKVELFTPEGQHFEMSMSARIYTLPELCGMLRSSGFRIIDAYGGYNGQPVSFDAKRTIVVGQRED